MQYITDFHQAELNAAKVMRSWGFTGAVSTTGGADGGIDVQSSRALAQVKWRGGAAGRPDLQKLFGARGTGNQYLFFFAASSYTGQAVKYADEVGIALFIYDPTGATTAANKHAREFAAAPTIAATPARIPVSDVLLLGAGAIALTGAVILLVLTGLW